MKRIDGEDHLTPDDVMSFIEGCFRASEKLGLGGAIPSTKIKFTTERSSNFCYYHPSRREIVFSVSEHRALSGENQKYYNWIALDGGAHEAVHAIRNTNHLITAVKILTVELPCEIIARITGKTYSDICPVEKEAIRIAEEVRREKYGF